MAPSDLLEKIDISPLLNSTNRFEIESPRPVDFSPDVPNLPEVVNASKISSVIVSEIPIPSSETWIVKLLS